MCKTDHIKINLGPNLENKLRLSNVYPDLKTNLLVSSVKKKKKVLGGIMLVAEGGMCVLILIVGQSLQQRSSW